MPQVASHSVSYSFATESTRHNVAAYSRPFSTWNLFLYICLLNPLICLYNMYLTLKYAVLYIFSQSALRSIHQRVTVDLERQTEKSNAPVDSKKTVLTVLLRRLAMRHLQNIRVQIVTDDDSVDRDCECNSESDRPLSPSRLSQSDSSALSGATDDDKACLRPPEPAYHGSSIVPLRTLPLLTIPQCQHQPRAPFKFEFSLSRMLIMHIFAPLVSIGLVFAGCAAALACFYSVCLGEPINENDTAYLWRTWARWIFWPVQQAHIKVVPVKE
ncbi:uncharacterized protein V1513DRAFT_436961 [Lipomyces chichibuensis]|uniref:uncharacterized protein n=1 Tax=Lipomyces chichibuensis TaxID=1546026 RepID=UPI00334402AC